MYLSNRSHPTNSRLNMVGNEAVERVADFNAVSNLVLVIVVSITITPVLVCIFFSSAGL